MHCTPPATMPVTTSVKKYVPVSAGIFLDPIPLSSPVGNIQKGEKG